MQFRITVLSHEDLRLFDHQQRRQRGRIGWFSFEFLDMSMYISSLAFCRLDEKSRGVNFFFSLGMGYSTIHPPTVRALLEMLYRDYENPILSVLHADGHCRSRVVHTVETNKFFMR